MKSITVKKSDMAAQGNFDYRRLCVPGEYLIPCQVEEKREELVFTYETEFLKEVTLLRKEGRKTKLAVLLDGAGLAKMRLDYVGSLKPSNLYYDGSCRIRLLERDVYRRGEGFDPEEFLMEYKALIGFVMQRRYRYEDYRQGGLKLLEKNSFLAKIGNCETIDQVKEVLLKAYEEETAYLEERKILVDRGGYRRKQVCLALGGICLAAALGTIGYWSYLVIPKERAVAAASMKYIEKDYVGIIDAMKPLEVGDLDLHHKYILAESYVRGESLSREQRENILSGLSLKGDERILRYWIQIGRLNPVEAENIAMQCSDDELLLYAYLKEKNLTEIDTGLTGEEKAAKLSALEKKIQDLSKKYGTEE